MILLIAASFAADPNDTIKTWGDLRWLGSTLSDFPVDSEGDTVGQGFWVDQRIRAGIQADVAPLVSLQGELDALTGQLAGDTWDVPGTVDARHRERHTALTLDGVVLRRALLQTYVGNVQIRAGLDTSHWGLGLVANDGAHDPLFGRTDLGDRVLRLRATHIPQAGEGASTGTVLTTAALDFVVADDISQSHWVGTAEERATGATAGQAILSALWLGRSERKAGVYGVVRQQWEQAGERSTTALVFDGYGETPFDVEGWTVRLAGEAAGIGATTDRATTYNSRDGILLMSWGAVAEATATDPSEKATAILRGGFASGDADPDDKVARDFGMDPNVGAGMVLFDQVIGSIDAATHHTLSDPERAGQPPDGIDALVTEGGVRHGTFVQPAVKFAATPWFEARLGGVFAWSTSPVSQPFYTFRAGGTPHNHHDLPTDGRRFLGSELDWALRFGPTDPDKLRPSFEVQGGHAALGKALQGAGPNVIHHVQAAARLQW